MATADLVTLHRAVNERRDALEQALRDETRDSILAETADDDPLPMVSIEYREDPRLPPIEVFDVTTWQAREYIRTLVWEMQDELDDWTCDGEQSAPAYNALRAALSAYDDALDASLR